jgi:competence protein ComEC
MSPTIFARNPFIALSFFLIIGILVGDIIDSIMLPLVLGTISIIIYIYLSIKSRNAVYAVKLQPYHWLWIGLLVISLGIFVSYVTKAKDYDFDNEIYPPIAIGRINNIKENTEQTNMLVTVTTLYRDSLYKQDGLNINVLLSSSDALPYRVGDVISFVHSFKRIEDSGNKQNEFYADYMKRQGVLYRQWVRAKDLKYLSHKTTPASYALEVRDKLITMVELSALEQDTKDFIISIIFGDKDYLHADTIEQFRKAGISHILALSGLHVGIIIIIIGSILYPLQGIGLRRTRWLIIIISVWCFAFIVGLSTSVIRACIMATIYYVTKILERKNSSVNSLFAAIFFILIISPHSLQDAGFLLSVTTVFSLLIFASKLNPIDRHKHHIYYNIVGALLTVITALAGSIGITAYYFHSLPLSSIVPNILVCSILPLYMTCSIIYIILSALGITFYALGHILNYGYDFINLISDYFSTGIFSQLQVYPSAITIILYYISLLLIAGAIYYKFRAKYTISASAAIFLTIASIIFLPSNAPKDGFIIQNTPRSQSIRVYHNGRDTVYDFSTNKITEFSVYNKKIAIIDHTLYKRDELPEGYIAHPIDMAVIGKDYHGKISTLLKYYKPQMIIALRDIYPQTDERFESESKSYHIPYYSIRISGPLKIMHEK